MSEPEILREEKNGVLTLTLNRPAALNALNQPLFEAFNREVYQARFDENVRVLVIQGAGKNFCAGVDMEYIENVVQTDLALRTFANLDLVRHIVRMDKPVVARVAGNAIGAGFSLALLADFVIAAEDAVFQMPFTRLGAVIDMGASLILPRLVGMARAKAIAMLGERISGKEAADWGLIYKALPAAELDAAVVSLTDRLLRLSPEALGLTKRGLDLAHHWDIDETVDWETTQQMKLIPGEYVQKQISAFRSRKGGS